MEEVNKNHIFMLWDISGYVLSSILPTLQSFLDYVKDQDTSDSVWIWNDLKGLWIKHLVSILSLLGNYDNFKRWDMGTSLLAIEFSSKGIAEPESLCHVLSGHEWRRFHFVSCSCHDVPLQVQNGTYQSWTKPGAKMKLSFYKLSISSILYCKKRLTHRTYFIMYYANFSDLCQTLVYCVSIQQKLYIKLSECSHWKNVLRLVLRANKIRSRGHKELLSPKKFSL